MNLAAGNLALRSPEIERGGLDIELSRKVLDCEEHEIQPGESYDTPSPPPETVRPLDRRRLDAYATARLGSPDADVELPSVSCPRQFVSRDTRSPGIGGADDGQHGRDRLNSPSVSPWATSARLSLRRDALS